VLVPLLPGSSSVLAIGILLVLESVLLGAYIGLLGRVNSRSVRSRCATTSRRSINSTPGEAMDSR
jgi:hypothetical protein